MQIVTRYTRWLIFILIAFALPAQAQADLAAFAIAGDVPREKPAPTRGSPALYVSGPDRSQEQTDWDSPFGFHPAGVFKRGYQDSGYTDATNIGVGWTRQGVYAFWFLIQPDLNQQVYDFSFYDRQWGEIPWDMNILANIAPQGRIDEGRCLPESWLPVDEAKYAAFVTATVERYDGDGIDDMPGLVNPIRHWQVGNEPNDRRPSDFAELQRITYQAIKQACPDCTVLIGGVPGGPENYITNFDVAYAPILAELAGQYVDVFDFHWYGTATGEYRLRDAATGEDVLEHIRATLTAHGFPADLPLWITEMGAYSGDPTREPDIFPFQTERQQALDYFKRFIYPLSRGVEKVFPAFGLMEGFKYDSGYFDFTGLIYDGWGPYDMGLGVKKLGYFTYKKMTEKLEGSDWDNIETVINGTDNVYAYKFTKKDTSEPIWVVWWDYFDDTGSSKTISLDVGNINSVKITEAVPNAESGAGLNENDYPNFFNTETKAANNGEITITLGKDPVFIEQTVKIANYEDSPFGFIQGEVVQGQRPSAQYLNDLGVFWNKIAPGGNVGIVIETDDPNNINFQTDVNFSGMDAYLQTLVVDNGINITMPLMVFVKVNGEETKLDFDDYEELATVMIERYDGDGVNDAPGSPLIKYWSLGGSEMNTGVAQGVPVEDRKWPLTEAQTAEYVKIGYDIVKELHPEFRAKLGGSSAVNSWQQDGIDDYYYNLASELTGSNKCSDLIFDYHQGSNPFQFKRQIECMNIVDETLNEFGYNGNEIWTTDCGGSWEEWQGFTEAEQAGDVIRRYAYTIANGQEKLFWTRVEEYNWTPDDSSMFDYMGLVHNPANNGGEDWKKLSYYAYKLMVGKLEGSAWDNIETVINGTDNVYAYKFTNKDTGEPVYVAWWDYFDEPGYTSGDTKTITLSGLTGTAITVTNAVPAAESGLDVTDYTTAFTITTYPVADGSSTIVLGEAPVFVEMFNIDIQANGSDGPLSITPNDALSVTVELDPGNNSEINADWWLAADTPFGWFYFDALTWSWTHVFTYAYQGALFELNPPFEVLDISELQTGAYTFYFAVDIDMNGTLDEPLYYDSVLVNVLD